MRRVFRTSAEVTHVWASQSQDEGRSGNVFFTGETIYSYGHHFPMARIVTRKGRRAVVITTRTYSMTTNRHLGDVRRAISHIQTFHVPLSYVAGGVSKFDFRSWFETYAPRVAELMCKASKARKYATGYFESARGLVNEANALAEFAGLRIRLNMPENFEEAIAQARELEAKRQRKQAAEDRRRAAQRAAEHARCVAEAEASLAEWLAGGNDRLRHAHLLPQTYMRLIDEGKTVQTSLDARVPADHAERAYRILRRLRERAETYKANGHTIHVGHFQIDELTDTGLVRAGCHKIQWPEVERLANLAGWNN